MKLIFSLDTNDRPASPVEYQSVKQRLVDFGVYADSIDIDGQGSYKGKVERSIVLEFFAIDPLNMTELMDEIKAIVFRVYSQESMLYVGANGQGFLMFKDSPSVQVGRWTKVLKADAMACDAWTKIGRQYFICKK